MLEAGETAAGSSLNTWGSRVHLQGSELVQAQGGAGSQGDLGYVTNLNRWHESTHSSSNNSNNNKNNNSS